MINSEIIFEFFRAWIHCGKWNICLVWPNVPYPSLFSIVIWCRGINISIHTKIRLHYQTEQWTYTILTHNIPNLVIHVYQNYSYSNVYFICTLTIRLGANKTFDLDSNTIFKHSIWPVRMSPDNGTQLAWWAQDQRKRDTDILWTHYWIIINMLYLDHYVMG